MSGMEEWVSRITIPSVFISHATGLALRNSSIATQGGVMISLNDTGHVKPKTKQIGPIETLATYVVVSLVLLSFSGCCGLLLALCVTCYQRAFRQRALRGLKVQTYKRPPPTTTVLAASTGAAAAAAAQSRVPTTTTSPGSGLSLLSGGTRLGNGAEDEEKDVLLGTVTAAAAVVEGASSISHNNSSERIENSVYSFFAGLGRFFRRDGPAAAASSSSSTRVGDPAGSPAIAAAACNMNKSAVAGAAAVTSSNSNNGLTPLRESWEDEERTLCAICLDDYEDGDTLR